MVSLSAERDDDCAVGKSKVTVGRWQERYLAAAPSRNVWGRARK
jgi:hypothetical protein